VTEGQLRWLYRNARALTSVSREDFGLTPVEANAFGTPALVLRSGGFLDSTREGESGAFIPDAEVESIVDAVRRFPLEWPGALPRANAKRFSVDTFGKQLRDVVDSVV
jgi:glycosyltransferase involved in cell wall biosynthesis